MKNKIKYELWLEQGRNQSFFPENNESARRLLSKDAKLIWTVEAETWEEAQAKRNEFLGTKQYKPME